MNYVVLSGKIVGNIDNSISASGMESTKFNLKNLYFSPKVNSTDTTYIRCITYGALARYVNSEMYEGANIMVTGRILNRQYIVNNTKIDRLYVGCNTVSKLEQEEYQ